MKLYPPANARQAYVRFRRPEQNRTSPTPWSNICAPRETFLAADEASDNNPLMLKKHPFVALVSILAIRVAGFLSIQAAVVSMNPGADAFVTTGPANNLATNNSGGGGSLAMSAT